MKLPQREFYTLQEVAARWGCTLADIAGWSTAGQLDVVTGSRLDLARELGLSVDTLRRWDDRRTGPACVRAGRTIYYRRAVVLDWLEKQESTKRANGKGRRSTSPCPTRPLSHLLSPATGCTTA